MKETSSQRKQSERDYLRFLEEEALRNPVADSFADEAEETEDEDEPDVLAKYDPDQARDENGRWTSGGSSSWNESDVRSMKFNGMTDHDISTVKGMNAQTAPHITNSERRFKGQHVENAMAAKAGKFLFENRGTATFVSFTKDQLSQMRGAVLTHNHPSGNSFSDQDVLLAHQVGMQEVRAIAPDGTVYRLREGKRPWSDYSEDEIKNGLLDAEIRANFTVRPVLEPRVTEWEKGNKEGNSLSPNEASKIHTHWRMQEFAEITGLRYERILGPDVKREEFPRAAA